MVALFQPPDRDMKIWRYMDLTKLVAFLETGSLHFARADTLGDPYEGSWTTLNPVAREEQLGKIFDSTEGKTRSEEIHQIFKNAVHFEREHTYINCWHGGATENAAMWKLYGTVAGAIAIQSTYQKLVDALPDDVYMGMVQYEDYNSSEDRIRGGDIMSPFIHKRREFEYESEVRAFIRISEGSISQWLEKGDDKQLGIPVNIDIDKVVQTIRAQPTTPAWARESIEKLIKKYGWGMKVMPSQIDIPPTY